MNVIKIAIFGANLNSINYGCTALGIAQIRMLQDIVKECGLSAEYYIFEDGHSDFLEQISDYIDINNIWFKYTVRIKTGLKGILKLKRDIKACDLFIDLTYGDSFADIYGLKIFLLYSLPKYFAIRAKKICVLGPQTYGPYYHGLARWIASRILKKASYIFARDELSHDLVANLTQRKDICITSDLAMSLPYIKGLYDLDKIDGRLNIGLNVSQLMWVKNESNSNLQVKLDYKELIETLIQELIKRNHVVHLITHVYDASSFNEYSLAEQLHNKFEDTILAPQFSNPMEAKSYMSELDIFIGSRMHATIGAFSAGVPVIPISYSRKFEGLYNTLGYNHCIDCSKETVDSALKLILEKIDQREQLEKERGFALKIALQKNDVYRKKLEEILKSIAKKKGEKVENESIM